MQAQAVYTVVLPSGSCFHPSPNCLQACTRTKLPSENCLQSGETGYTAENQAIGTQQTSQKST